MKRKDYKYLEIVTCIGNLWIRWVFSYVFYSYYILSVHKELNLKDI